MKASSASILFLVFIFFTQVPNALSFDETTGNPSQLRRRDQTRPIITRLELINAKTDRKISDLFYGQYVNVSSIAGLAGPEFNINAVVDSPVTFVRFGFNDNLKYRSEGTAPYAFCGNRRQNFFNCTDLGYGTHFVTAQAIANGKPGPLVQVTFTIAPI